MWTRPNRRTVRRRGGIRPGWPRRAPGSPRPATPRGWSAPGPAACAGGCGPSSRGSPPSTATCGSSRTRHAAASNPGLLALLSRRDPDAAAPLVRGRHGRAPLAQPRRRRPARRPARARPRHAPPARPAAPLRPHSARSRPGRRSVARAGRAGRASGTHRGVARGRARRGARGHPRRRVLRHVEAALPRLRAEAEELAALGVPDTIDHQDLHPGNMLGGRGGRLAPVRLGRRHARQPLRLVAGRAARPAGFRARRPRGPRGAPTARGVPRAVARGGPADPGRARSRGDARTPPDDRDAGAHLDARAARLPVESAALGECRARGSAGSDARIR